MDKCIIVFGIASIITAIITVNLLCLAENKRLVSQIASVKPQRSEEFKNEFYICGPITVEYAKQIIAELKAREADPEIDIIRMKICSNGGEALAAEAICRVMEKCRKPIEVRAFSVWSAGSLILLSGTPGKRFIHEHATVIIHRADFPKTDNRLKKCSYWMYKHIFEVVWFWLDKRWDNQLFVKNTGQPLKKVAKYLDRGTLFSAEGAVEFGIADSIFSW